MTYTRIFNGTLIDGTGRAAQADAAVLIEDNTIRMVGREDDVPRSDGQMREIDARGGWILPGLIDCHVHLLMEGVQVAQRMATPVSLEFFRAVDRMRRTLDAGVTSVRDAGGADLGVKRAVEDGLVAGPRMQIAVSILTTTGGHADFTMPDGTPFQLLPAFPGRPDGVCDGVDAVRKKAREVLRAGADILKVCATGGVLSPTDHPEFTQFSPAELEALVQEGAYRRGTKVMAHAQGTEGIKNAVRAGVHSIEHGIYLDDEAIDLLVRASDVPGADAAGRRERDRDRARDGGDAGLGGAQGRRGLRGASREHRPGAQGGRADRHGHGFGRLPARAQSPRAGAALRGRPDPDGGAGGDDAHGGGVPRLARPRGHAGAGQTG